MRALEILVLSVVLAIAYGILHDQVTVRLSLEYFTIGHPTVIESHGGSLLARRRRSRSPET